MKKKYIWLIEILVWIIIISSLFFYFVIHAKIEDSTRSMYYIFVDDAGGIVKGSPVRLMGINIGYVKDVKIFDNKVFISFLVTKKNVSMPKKTAAIIEFYGLGGSTSLELMPDNMVEVKDRDVIVPQNAYRVKDFWDGQALVSNVLIDIYGGIGRNIEASDILNHKDYIKQSALVKDIIQQTNNINAAQTVVIYNFTENLLKFGKSIPNNSENIDSGVNKDE